MSGADGGRPSHGGATGGASAAASPATGGASATPRVEGAARRHVAGRVGRSAARAAAGGSGRRAHRRGAAVTRRRPAPPAAPPTFGPPAAHAAQASAARDTRSGGRARRIFEPGCTSRPKWPTRGAIIEVSAPTEPGRPRCVWSANEASGSSLGVRGLRGAARGRCRVRRGAAHHLYPAAGRGASVGGRRRGSRRARRLLRRGRARDAARAAARGELHEGAPPLARREAARVPPRRDARRRHAHPRPHGRRHLYDQGRVRRLGRHGPRRGARRGHGDLVVPLPQEGARRRPRARAPRQGRRPRDRTLARPRPLPDEGLPHARRRGQGRHRRRRIRPVPALPRPHRRGRAPDSRDPRDSVASTRTPIDVDRTSTM